MLEKEEIQLSRQDRINTLKSATEILKKEFVGLDDVIDEIMKSVKPWYITPEVIKRPVIVSLFGMTGTGKSSVVKRLTELLKINNKTLYFFRAKWNKHPITYLNRQINGDSIIKNLINFTILNINNNFC